MPDDAMLLTSIDPERLIAFLLVTAATSIVPGPSMIFVMSQAVWRGARSGWAALAGMQLGYIVWWVLAALGLGTLAKTFPVAFHALAVAGALYLAWLGVQAIRHSRDSHEGEGRPRREPSRHAFRDGIFVAVSNPKALVYMVAILPPFIDQGAAIVPQLIVLAVVAMVADVAVGAVYIFAGSGLARAMTRPGTRMWIDRCVGMVFILIAIGILADLFAIAGAA